MTTESVSIGRRDAGQGTPIRYTPEHWASLVRADLGRAVEGFLAAGQHLTEAKADLPHGTWESWCSKQVGISPETARRLMIVAQHEALSNPNHGLDLPPHWQTLYELSQLEPEWLERAIESGKVTPEMERKQARALVVEYKQLAAQVAFDVRHGDFREVFDDLEPGSVDAVITDPPYSGEHMHLYSSLAEHAVKWLRPGGIAAVMTGQTHLPEVMVRLEEHLDYHWTIAYFTPGGQAVQVFPRKANTYWKPVLLYSNGPADLDWFGDVARSEVNDNDKRFHDWGQSESGMADLVKRVSRPAQRVLDPFLGAGTTGVVALVLGRSFLGCDVNLDHVEAARQRLEQAVLDRLGAS